MRSPRPSGAPHLTQRDSAAMTSYASWTSQISTAVGDDRQTSARRVCAHLIVFVRRKVRIAGRGIEIPWPR